MKITVGNKEVDPNNIDQLIDLIQNLEHGSASKGKPQLTTNEYLKENFPVAHYDQRLKEVMVDTDDGYDFINLRIALNRFAAQLDKDIIKYFK